MRQAMAKGFTLLEVMIALAILGMSLTIISHSQQNSVRAANRAKWMSVAAMLARYKMSEVEDQLYEEGFTEFTEEDSGDFEEEGFGRFSYTVTIDKVELPTGVDAEGLTGDLGGAGEGSDNESGQGGLAAMGGQMLMQQFEMIRNVLEQSIRRVQLRVFWPEGSQTREVTVVGYFTDPRTIDAAASGNLPMPGAGALPGTGSSGGSGSSSGSAGTNTVTPTSTGRSGGVR